MHWSFGVQQELIRNTVSGGILTRHRGVKLQPARHMREKNCISPFAGAPKPDYPKFRTFVGLANFNQFRLHALQASLRRRVAKGVNVDANYTWAHEPTTP